MSSLPRFLDDGFSVGLARVHPDAPCGGTGNGSARIPGPVREILPVLAPGFGSPVLAHAMWSEVAAVVEQKRRIYAVTEASEDALRYLAADLYNSVRYGFWQDLCDLLISLIGLAQGAAVVAGGALAILAAGGLLVACAPEVGLLVAVVLALMEIDEFAGAGYAVSLEISELGQNISTVLGLGNDYQIGEKIGRSLLLIAHGAREAWGAPDRPNLEPQTIHLGARQISQGLAEITTILLNAAVSLVNNKVGGKINDHLPKLPGHGAKDGGELRKELGDKLEKFAKKYGKHLVGLPR